MLYDSCRHKQLTQREVPKTGGKTEIRYIEVPTGFTVLPFSGGLLDQPAFLVDAFQQFMAAERAVASKKLTSKL